MAREGRFEQQQFIAFLAAQNIAEIIERCQRGREEGGRGAALERLANLLGGVDAEQFEAHVLADFFGVGGVVVVVELGNAQKTQNVKVEFHQVLKVGRGLVALEHVLGLAGEFFQR